MEKESGEVESSNNENQVAEQVWSWGAGEEGQLGTGRLEDDHSPQLLLLQNFPSSISALACGGAHVLALTSDGRVFSWGRGTSGQLGHGDIINSFSPKPVTFFNDHFVSHVAAGWNHSGFVTDSGSVYTCGDGSFGQLGHGDYRSLSSPVKVSYFSSNNVQRVACGMRHSLVLLKDCLGNQVYGFGSGKRGQLGISVERIKSVSLPQVTNGFEDVEIVGINANGDHSAALSANGHLYTWGKGFDNTPDVHCPQCLPSSSQFSKVALGWNHALLLTGSGEVYMLGGSNHGVLSDPQKMSLSNRLSENASEPNLKRVAALDGVKVFQIAVGAEHSAVVAEDGMILTWGWGEHGQLGLGDTHDQIDPQVVKLGNPAENKDKRYQIYCGSGFTYAIGRRCAP